VIRLLKVDPLSKETGLLMPFAVQRILKMARETPTEYNGEALAQQWVRRLIAQDPGILLLAFVEGSGRLVGHCLCCLDGAHGRQWVLVLQAKTDVVVGKRLRQACIDFMDSWGRSYGATQMLMGTSRDAAVWERLYGFKTTRVVMERTLGAPLRRARED